MRFWSHFLWLIIVLLLGLGKNVKKNSENMCGWKDSQSLKGLVNSRRNVLYVV